MNLVMPKETKVSRIKAYWQYVLENMGTTYLSTRIG